MTDASSRSFHIKVANVLSGGLPGAGKIHY
jgi:hypothetical protein